MARGGSPTPFWATETSSSAYPKKGRNEKTSGIYGAVRARRFCRERGVEPLAGVDQRYALWRGTGCQRGLEPDGGCALGHGVRRLPKRDRQAGEGGHRTGGERGH